MNGLSFQAIGEEEGSRLERDFEESEVFEVVKNLNGDKAIGPNGFSLFFFSNLLGDVERGYNGSF
jgi:hypothetical protein